MSIDCHYLTKINDVFNFRKKIFFLKGENNFTRDEMAVIFLPVVLKKFVTLKGNYEKIYKNSRLDKYSSNSSK